MATIGNIVVNMVANTVKFDANLKKSNTTINIVKQSTAGLSKAMGALGVSIGSIGFATMIKSSLDAGDKIHKLNIRIGASTEALSQYKHVADLSGVSFQALTIGWQRQTRRISEAANGTGEATKALKELGLSAQALNALAPERQFEILSEALNGVSNQADKVRLAMKFWDSEGVALLQIASAGADEIARMRLEADRLGLTLTQLQAEKMAKANDAITRMKGSFTGLANTIAIQAGPSIVAVTNAMSFDLPKAMKASAAAVAVLKFEFFNASAAIYELLAARDQLDVKILPSQESLVGKGLSFLGLDATSEQALESAKTNLTKAISLREKASAEASTLIVIAEDMKAGFTVGGGSPFSMLANQDDSDTSLAIAQGSYDSHLALYKDAANQRLKIEQQTNSLITSSQIKTWSQAATLLRLFSQEHKAFALASIAIETSIAIAQAKINTSVAVTKALSLDPTGILAARVASLGAIQVGLIAATGLARGGLALSGSGGGGGSASAAGGFGGQSTEITNQANQQAQITQPLQPVIIQIGDEKIATIVTKGLIIGQDNDMINIQTEQGFERVIVS